MPFTYFPLTLKKFVVTAEAQNSLIKRVGKLTMFGFTQIMMVVQLNDERTTIELQTLSVSGHARNVRSILKFKHFPLRNPSKTNRIELVL